MTRKTAHLNMEVDDHPDYGWQARVTCPDYPEDWFIARGNYTFEEELSDAVYHICLKYWPYHWYTISSCTVKDNDDGGHFQPMLQRRFDQYKEMNENKEGAMITVMPGYEVAPIPPAPLPTVPTVPTYTITSWIHLWVYDPPHEWDLLEFSRDYVETKAVILPDVMHNDGQVVGKFIRSICDMETNKWMVECEMWVNFESMHMSRTNTEDEHKLFVSMEPWRVCEDGDDSDDSDW
jgi:hypothetical protein